MWEAGDKGKGPEKEGEVRVEKESESRRMMDERYMG
jgi:hypothetical protein